jgi:hypothetical protein
MEGAPDRADDRYPPYLRLVWSRPEPAPRRPTNLALAIEHHLAGADGLTDDDFLQAYSGRTAR